MYLLSNKTKKKTEITFDGKRKNKHKKLLQ